MRHKDTGKMAKDIGRDWSCLTAVWEPQEAGKAKNEISPTAPRGSEVLLTP